MIMKNAGLFVRDLEGARKFFEDYFEMKIHAVWNEPEKGYYSYIMKFNDDPQVARIEIMTKPEIVDQPKDCNRTGWAHVCIKVDSKEQFDRINAKCHEAGYEILYEPATVGGKEMRAIMLEDNVIEVLY
jgi:lactoylglutathione lyase